MKEKVTSFNKHGVAKLCIYSIVHVWKIVPPASVFSAVLFLLTLVMAWSVSHGLGAFFSGLDGGVHMK